MTNAKDELLNVLRRAQIDLSEIRCADVWYEKENDDFDQEDYFLHTDVKVQLAVNYSSEQWTAFIEALNFEYYSGYGAQCLYGTVWLTEGRWLTRGEYDGSEWWDLHVYPEIPDVLK